MEATEILMQEHRVIERVLTTLEAGAALVDAGQPIRPGFFIEATDFVRGFADGCHHRKEEACSSPRWSTTGLPRESGPVAVMLAEHEEGRGPPAACVLLCSGWKPATLRPAEVTANARSYTALLRQHIYKEDNILFPMADQVIPRAAQAQVSEGFEHVEHEETGEGVHEKYLALADALEREIAVM